MVTPIPERQTSMRRTSSSTVAIGAATLFLVVTAAASFVADDSVVIGRGWALRGALIPAAEASAVVNR